MVSLHANAAPTDAYTWTGSFADVTGYSETVTIGSATSVVLIFAMLNIDLLMGESTGAARFTRGGSPIGPEINICMEDATDEGSTSMLVWAETGISGSVTYKVQAKEVAGVLTNDADHTGAFVIIELTSAEATLRTSGALTSAASSGASYADVTGHTLTYTPAGASSLHLLIGNIPTGSGADTTSLNQFSIGGTELGYGINRQGSDSVNQIGESLNMLAVTGQTGSTTFSQEWKSGLSGQSVDTGRNRYFHAIELLDSTLHHDADANSIAVTTSWATPTGGSSTETIGSTDSIVLFVMTPQVDFVASSSDRSCFMQFARGGTPTREGPDPYLGWTDSASGGEFTSTTMAWAITGISGSDTFHSQQIEAGGNATLFTELRFQLIEIKKAAGGIFIPYPNPRYSLVGGMQPMYGGVS